VADALRVRSNTGLSLLLLLGVGGREGLAAHSHSLGRRSTSQPVAFILSPQLFPLGPKDSP
jgi:hypothetical protein